MSTDNFDVKVLAEKLSKLNNSQQSIESLSRWCVSNRKKARQVVETWEKTFNLAEKDQRVSFLFLANDILQNSRRKGSEFVNEFWKVLPNALKYVNQNGDEHGKKTVSRLVDIWEERKVFGSRAPNLKEVLSGKEPSSQVPSQGPSQALSQSVSNGKSLNPVKIVKKDAQAIRIKLPVGDVLEKIVTAFYNLHEECSSEEATLAKCHVAVLSSDSLEKEVETVISQGIQPGSAMFNQLQDHESILLQCVEQLEGAEATRLALVSQLKEALQDQGKKLEILQSQLQIARRRITASGKLRQAISSGNNTISPLTTSMDTPTELENPWKTTSSFGPLGATSTTATTEENNKKATAAAVAAKLAASSSSSQMFVSVLSSLVAEEAAKAGKRQKLDTPVSDSAFGANTPFYSNHLQSVTSPPFSATNSQPASSLPPPPANQFMPPGGMMMPFAFVSGSLPPPPIPLSVPMSLGRPPAQQPQPPPVSSVGGSGGYYRPPPTMGVYGQGQQATTPAPVQHQ